MISPHYTLISHTLCPYVQRAVIALKEQGLPYKRIDVDLANKPDWFKKLSPLGKVPVLVIDDDTVVFESAVISEYLNEANQGTLLKSDPLKKAHQKSWIEFASHSLNNMGQIYNAPDQKSFETAVVSLTEKWHTLENNLTPGGYFNGPDFSLVDAAFAPVFRYIPIFEALTSVNFFKGAQAVNKWAQLLMLRPSVQQAVSEQYPELLMHFISKRDSYLGQLAKQHLNEKILNKQTENISAN